jgi:hypothetical protein
MFSLKNLVIHCCISYFKSLSLSSLKFNVLPGLYLSAQCPDTVVLLPWWRQLECLSPCNMDPKHTQPMQARFAPSQHILHSYNIKWGFTKAQKTHFVVQQGFVGPGVTILSDVHLRTHLKNMCIYIWYIIQLRMGTRMVGGQNGDWRRCYWCWSSS